MGSLKGKTALITGSGRGIGFGIAQVMAQKGANIMINDIVVENAENAVQLLLSEGYEADFVVADVADKKQVTNAFEKTLKRFSKLDILVNNAGIVRRSHICETSLEEWEQVIANDLTSVFLCTQAAALHMRKRKYGRIINISSIGCDGNYGESSYSAAKSGILGLTKTTAKELAEYGITVNAICPGFIESPLTLAFTKENWEKAISSVPLSKAGTAADIGYLVAFLASDEASYITKEVITVGGGMVL